MVAAGAVLLALALLGVLWPRWLTIPFALISGWLAVSLFIGGYRLYRTRRKEMNRFSDTKESDSTEKKTSG
jgi:cardiolipin synthase